MLLRRTRPVVVLAVLMLLAVVGCSRAVSGTATADPVAVAQSGVVSVGKSSQSITMFLDFTCPACGMLERRDGAAITAAITAGRVRVDYRPVSFLDPQTASRTYSSRALQAFLAVGAASSATVTQAFLAALFTAQPVEGGRTDPSNADIAATAGAAGVSDGVIARIRAGATGIDGAAVGRASMQRLSALGGTGVPTVFHRGQQVDLSEANWLEGILRG